MEQKAKKYDELNIYEKHMANLSIEQRLEVMAKELEQIATVLKMSVHINSTFCAEDNHSVEVTVFPKSHEVKVIGRDVENTGDLFGIIDEAFSKKPSQD